MTTLKALSASGLTAAKQPLGALVSAEPDVILLTHNFSSDYAFPKLAERKYYKDSPGPFGIKTGDFTVNFDTKVNMTFVQSNAGYNNTIGYYTILDDGTISTTKLAFTNANAVKAGATVSFDVTPLANDFGFFLIADGYDTNKSFKGLDLTNGTLSFVYDNGKGTERAAKITDTADHVSLVYTLNGIETVLKGDIYHTTTRGGAAGLNADGLVHTVSGLATTGDTSKLRVGFEDLYKLGDGDYNDVIFDVSVAGSRIVISSGTAGDDTLRGSDRADRILGLAGNDVIYGSSGNDTLDGGAGSDTVNYSLLTAGLIVNLKAEIATKAGGYTDTLIGFEHVVGSAYADEIRGTTGDNTLNGGDGDDLLFGDYGNDTLYGGNGVDRLIGDTGNDILYGEAGDDRLEGSVGNDILYGGDGIDRLLGGDGDDVLYGDAGDDRIEGGEGNDTLIGGAGNDRIDGGNGIDTVDYSSHAAGVTVILGSHADVNGDGVADDDILFIENAIGTAFNDSLRGDALDNTLWGNDGADYLEGNGGNDILYGGAGNDDHVWVNGNKVSNGGLFGGNGDDTLYGGEGNDRLEGGNDNDTLYGGAGADRLTGGAGNDRFVLDVLDGSLDKITDFALGQDVLDISDVLSGYDINTSDINNFVRLIYRDANRVDLVINADGVGNDGVTVAQVFGSNFQGLSVTDLINNGSLIAV